MSGLPKLDLPLFELVLPSTGKKIQYRPFTVKEEKILLIAQESKDIDQIVLAIKQIIGNCVTNIDVERLATFDFEYILLHIRGKSINNLIDLKIRDPDTQESISLSINIDEVTLKKDPEHTNRIQVNANAVILMRYPTLNEVSILAKGKATSEVLFNAMISCIDQIVVDDSVYKTEDFTEKELLDFVDQLTPNVLADIQKFFETIPVLRMEIPYKNKNGDQKTFVMEGMETFFM
jgi:hypothetical protein